jgi:predicted ATPase
MLHTKCQHGRGKHYLVLVMIISKITLKNWRNFENVETDLSDRVFLVGPNAAGKSNFLDVFKFLRDIALPRAGLQEAINQRGGVPKIRCLSARRQTEIGITVELKNIGAERFSWRYSIGIKLEQRGTRGAEVAQKESPSLARVWRILTTFQEQVKGRAEIE